MYSGCELRISYNIQLPLLVPTPKVKPSFEYLSAVICSGDRGDIGGVELGYEYDI